MPPATVDQVPALISYIDSDYRYQLANQTYERWFGERADRVVGAHVREVLGKAAWEAVRPRMEAALAGKTASFQEQLPYRGGARWVHVIYTPDRDPTGRVRGFVVLVTDISERIASEDDHRALCPQLHGIAVSGFGMKEDVRRSRSAGFAEHLTKPIDLPAFEEALKRFAGLGQAAAMR